MTSDEQRGELDQAEFDALLKEERWAELEDRLRTQIRDHPKNHWAVTCVAMACNEQRRYHEAKEWSDLAYGLDPRCPLVRWDRAGIYEHLGDSDRAIAFWKSLLDTPDWERRDSPCWESEEWNQRIFADCWYRLSVAYARSGSGQDSMNAEAMYKKLISNGAQSIYTVDELEQALEKARRTSGS